MIQLRPYQNEAVAAIYAYFQSNSGNPIVSLPTGSGKSLTMASFIQSAIKQYPATRILLLAHVRELLAQNTKAILRYWPDAPVGIWSAGLGRKDKAQITVAGIQSIHKWPTKFADTDLIVIDECHLLSHKQDTTYRRFVNGIKAHNPHLKIVGFTATEYRQDSGLLTEGSGHVFTDVCYKADVGDLIKQGYLCPLISKRGLTKADLSSVHTRGGEFVPKELQDVMDKAHLIYGAMEEIEALAHDRKHILGFCAGVEHAAHCAEAARSRGHIAEYLSGDMSTTERDAILGRFTSGKTRILFNANILTTGFDFEAIDCIVMLRPTKSTGLYVQIMGRGLRKHACKENTLILDFAGNVERHGPIDQIKVKRKSEKGEGVSVAPVKECPNCQALVHAGVRECPECGNLFPENEAAKHGTEAADAVVVAALEKPRTYTVDRVEYRKHVKIGRPPSMRVTYWCGPSSFDEYVPLEDDRSYVKKHAVKWFWEHGTICPETVDEALNAVISGHRVWNQSREITVKLDGKYWRVIDRVLDQGNPPSVFGVAVEDEAF